MFEDVGDYLSKLCFWRLPSAEGKITGIEIDKVTGRVLVYYQFSLGNDDLTREWTLPTGYHLRLIPLMSARL